MGGPSAGQKLTECMLSKPYAKPWHGILRKSVPEFRVRFASHARTPFLTETTAWNVKLGCPEWLDPKVGAWGWWGLGVAGPKDGVGMNPLCAGDILPRNGYNTASGARGSLNL